MTYCPNRTCPAQIFRLLTHFAGRGAMDIEGLGESMADQLLRNGLVNDLADLFTLQIDDLLKLERMGEKSASNLIQNIAASKQRPLARLLFGLGVRHVGFETAELLAPYEEWQGLAGEILLLGWARGLVPGASADQARIARRRARRAA